MAKKLVKNYFFTPGAGLDDNLSPNAYSLVLQNRQFIIKEIVAFIQNQIDGATKCQRDIGYVLDGVGFDLALGTNYNSIFLGLAEYNSLDISETVVRAINRSRTLVLALSAVSGSATAIERVNAFYDELIDISTNGRANADTLSFPNPTGASASVIAAKTRLVNNIDFITAEINAWVNVNYPDHDHDEAKCTRDIKYAVNALCYDILYGGNSATYDQAKFFFYVFADGSPGIDPTHRAQTVAAYGRLKTIVSQIALGSAVSKSVGNTAVQDTSGTSADGAEATTLQTLVQITADVVTATSQGVALGTLSGISRTVPSVTWAAAGLQSARSAIVSNKTTIQTNAVGYTDYTYDTLKCERDSGYVIDALLHDMRYGGNEEIYRVASRYWDGPIAQIDGSRFPEYDAYVFTQDLINLYILTNTEDTSPEQGVEPQVIDLTKTAEPTATDRVTTLLGNVVDVITNGLSSLPTLDVQLSRIEILGKVGLEDLLLISNVTANTVIYNFAEPLKGGTVTFIEENTENYPQALTVNNGVTVIRFKYNTESMSSTDAIQIFLENTELKVRPYDFGTDAIERMRVGLPQAMIDADFEYGLQPTKWQAIGMQRGYPATYEVSATDIGVVNVVTDASNGTSGVGASLITVTTVGDHGLAAGNPITIRALASSITGFNRAEGTFLVFSVTSSTSFTFYAKAKVGTSNGQVLATSTTQLRSASFYTGAAVGTPTFTVFSQGSSGSFITALRSEISTNTLSFIGAAPVVGSPLSGTGMPTGVQVTGVFGDANSDGIQDYRRVKTTYGSGVNSISLTSVAGITAGMALGNGAVPNLLREITSIVGNTLNLSGTLSVGKTGDQNTYIGSATAVVGNGTSATLDLVIDGASITTLTINTAGSNYQVGDTLKVLGSDIGGTSPANDVYFNVTSVGAASVDSTLGAITGIQYIDGTPTGTGTFTNVTTTEVASIGSGATFTIVRADGAYTVSDVTGSMLNYKIGNRFTVPGTEFEGATPANDVTITVTGATGGGQIGSATASGTAARGDEIAVYATVTISDVTTAAVPATTTITYSAIATLQVDFSTGHGFVPGMGINVAITSAGTNHALASGPFAVEQIVSATRIRYVARAVGTIDTAITLSGTVYVRPDSFFTHRPFDGGVQLGTGGPQHGGHAIRQSKKYIRYQSGKGAMYNTGALFAPSFDIRSITATSTATGSPITVVTDDVDHGLQAGAVIRLSGVETTGYNGDYTVSEIIDERTFKVFADTALGSTTGTIGSQCQMATVNWHGACVRSGPFDDQNGIFFQYDGNQLAVGRRTSTFQCAGTIAINSNANAVTGTNTRFLDQLQEGDRIVIRGMTHVVATISSNTSMIVTPDFRGVNNVTGVKICKVQDLIIPQSEWNLDTCDGNGPSGYNIDITKMQMIGIQFSWYGAGFIDWMIRGPDGNYVFCHRLKGNNLNTEAYMRTGNLPVRYEVLNEGARSRLSNAINSSTSTIPVDNINGFPDSGTIYIDNELISYSSKEYTTAHGTFGNLLGCTRGTSLSNFTAGAVRTYTAGSAASHNDNQGAIIVSNTTSPIISHWGSAYLIDGLFDEDRGYLFNYAATNVSVSTTKVTAFLIRLAPSVSNAVVGDLGEKELLNRAQLLLNQIAVTTDASVAGTAAVGGIVVEGILNPSNYPTDPSNISWNALTGLSAGGQPSFAQIAPGGSVTWSGAALSATTTATTTAKMTQTVVTPNFGFTVGSGNNYFYLSKTAWEASNVHITGNNFTLTTGVVLDDAKFPAGTTITSVQGPYNYNGQDYYYITVSRPSTQAVNHNGSVTIQFAVGGDSLAVTSQLYFTAASWTSSGATTGTEISDAKFPANTRVSTVTGVLTFGGTSYRRVTFTQSSISQTTAGGTVTFKFGVPPYALPGEQVFSFVSNPGETNSLDLGQLKELTNTTIGGRGTFPNGPDVLAINVYKVSGDSVPSNIILRWGEAQA